MAIVHVNLLPPKVRQARQKRLLITGVVVAAALLLTIPVGIWYLRFQAVEGLRADIARIDAESAKYGDVIRKVQELQDSEAKLAKSLETLDKLVARQSLWVKLLEVLADAQGRAQDLWLVHLDSHAMTGADAGKIEINVHGDAFSYASVEGFRQALAHAELPIDLDVVTLNGVEKFGQRVVDFTFKMRVKV